MPARKPRLITADTPATVADLQRVTGLGENTIREAIGLGQLPGYRVGRRIVIPREAFDEFCAGRWIANPVRLGPIRPSTGNDSTEAIAS